MSEVPKVSKIKISINLFRKQKGRKLMLNNQLGYKTRNEAEEAIK